MDWIGDGHGGTNVFESDIPCYAAGTRILTARGEVAVENLAVGDKVVTVENGEQLERPIKWIGHRRLNLAAHPRPETVMPVRIRRDAFDVGIPHRDLLVSPDHAIFVDHVLICARQLVNGTTIRQEHTWRSVDYYHVELDRHAVILAEGLPAESYLDTGNKGLFQNSGEPLLLYPDLTDTDLPLRESGSCVPLVWKSTEVEPIWRRLADRGALLGRPVHMPETTSDPGLQLLANDRYIDPIYAKGGRYVFALPQHAPRISLTSRADAANKARPWVEDRRALGVRVTRLVLRRAGEVREIALDDPGLNGGWWAVERDGASMRRWTSGAAVVPISQSSQPTLLEVQISDEMSYVIPTDVASPTVVPAVSAA